MSISPLPVDQSNPFLSIDATVPGDLPTQTQELSPEEMAAQREVTEFLELLTQLENGDYTIPKKYEHFFTAPLNLELIERDYNIWKRVIGMSSNFFSQFAFKSRALLGGAAVFSSIVGIGLNCYPQVFIGTTSALLGGYYGIKNVVTSIFGNDSFKQRAESWKSASSQPSYCAAFAKRFSLLLGSNSLKERVGSIVKATLQGYLALVGYDLWSQIKDNPWTSYPVTGLEAIRSLIFPSLAWGLGIGIGFAAAMANWSFQSQAIQKINRDINAFSEDMNFSNEYERLLELSDDEYLSDLCSALRLLDYDMLKKARLEYREKILESLKSANYSFQNQLIVDPLEALSEVDKENPECALKPVVAQLIVLQKEKEKTLGSFKTLISLNQLPEAYQVLNEKLKPLIFKLEFLKQTILDPTRPQMGMLVPNGGIYRSYLSMLIGKEVNYSLQSQAPEAYELEVKGVLFQEAVLQKKFFHVKGKHEFAEFLEKIKSAQDVNLKA